MPNLLSKKYQRLAASRHVTCTSYQSQGAEVPKRLRQFMRECDKLLERMRQTVSLHKPDNAQDFAWEVSDAQRTLRNKARRCTGTPARKKLAAQARELAIALGAQLAQVRELAHARLVMPGSMALPDLDVPDVVPVVLAVTGTPPQRLTDEPPKPVRTEPPAPLPEMPQRSEHYWYMTVLAQQGALKEYREYMREHQQSYMSKGTGAVTRQKYARSAKGKAARKRYAASEKGKAARARYAQSEKGKQALQAAQARYRAKKQQVVK